MWMKELGVASDPRVKALNAQERLELARIASRNRRHAIGLVENRALINLHLPGVRETDQLGLVLTILDRLEHVGLANNGAYFADDKLFSVKPHELAGLITEMSYLAIVAEHAAINGLRTAASRRTAVPWESLPSGLLSELSAGWPRLSPAILSRLRARAEIDGYVIGDRIVEVKLRGRGRVPYSRMDEGDDETYVNEQLQALKLMAIAKRDGLRGVEFALFAEEVDEGWVRMVRTASERIGVGVQIFLHRGPEAVDQVLDTMPEMVRRGAPIVVTLPPLSPPPEKRRVTKAEEEWRVPSDDVEFMLGFIASDKRVRSQAEKNPQGFSHHVRPAHAKEILDGYQGTLDLHFDAQDQRGPRVGQSRREWGERLRTVGAQVMGRGNRLSVENARAMGALGAEIRAFVTGGADARRREIEARGRFLNWAVPRIVSAQSELEALVARLRRDDYTQAPTILSHLDAVREVPLQAEVSEMLRGEGLEALAELSLSDLLTEVERWKGERALAGNSHRLTVALQSYLNEWRSVIGARLPDAMTRWREEMTLMEEVAPRTEPFPRETASEFLARFEAMSSSGARGKGKKRGPTPQTPGVWSEAVSLLGLGGAGISPALGEEAAAAVALLPDDVGLLPAEVERLRYALEGIELFHVDEGSGDQPSSVFYYLPHVHTAAVRMIRAVLLTALLRHRPGTSLGLGRTLVFPWVMGTGQRGQQPFWLEVKAGGGPDQLVLERIVVIDKSQLPPRAVEGFLNDGLVLALPRDGGGTRMVHFDLVAPVAGKVPVDTFAPPPGTDVDAIARELVQASFRDRHPEGRHVEGESRFRPIEAGYLTVPEIEGMKLRDAYLQRHRGRGGAAGAEAADGGEEAGRFTAGRIRHWPEFIEQYLDMQRLAGNSSPHPASYYFLHVRTSHRGGTRVLLHLDRIRSDFGDHLRLRRIPGFALASEIAASGQRDAWGEPWTHSRLISLFQDIEARVPEAERGRYIRRFRSIAGGSRYSSLEPGQAALNLRELRRSPWGVYFRVERPSGFLRRQDLLARGMSPRSLELIVQFIERNVVEGYRPTYLRRIRGHAGKNEVIISLRDLARAYGDRLPADLMREVERIVSRGVSRAAREEALQRIVAELGVRIEALPPDDRPGLLRKLERLRAELEAGAPIDERDFSSLTRRIHELRADVGVRERRRGPGSGGGGESGGGSFGGVTESSGAPTPDSTRDDGSEATGAASGGEGFGLGGETFIDGAQVPLVVPPAGAQTTPLSH